MRVQAQRVTISGNPWQPGGQVAIAGDNVEIGVQLAVTVGVNTGSDVMVEPTHKAGDARCEKGLSKIESVIRIHVSRLAMARARATATLRGFMRSCGLPR